VCESKCSVFVGLDALEVLANVLAVTGRHFLALDRIFRGTAFREVDLLRAEL